MRDRFGLDGRRALVTGASSGIGQAIAVDLARAGAHVLAAGRSPCDATVAAIAAAGGTGEAFALDLTDPAAGAARLAGAGDLDILVNNAGTIRRADAVDYAEADWDTVLDVNLKAVFLLSQAFARGVLARGAEGRVVNIASVLSFSGSLRVPAYAASKHGVAGLTKALSNEWAAQGITVNAVAPGYVETRNTAALQADRARYDEILARIPAGRWAQPGDIAGAVTFLCGPAASYVTGAVLNVDGGWLGR